MKIALLCDDIFYKRRIPFYFEMQDFLVEKFEDTDEFLLHKNLHDFDILILDLDIKKSDVFEVLEYMQSNDINTPSIVISNKKDIYYIKRSFYLGSYDYLKKPFDIEELRVRIENVLRCTNSNKEIVLGDDIKYNFAKRELYYKDKNIKFTNKQHKIFYFLIKNRGQIVAKEILSEYVWEEDIKNYKTLASHIRDIHKKIGRKIIKNIKGMGYIIE